MARRAIRQTGCLAIAWLAGGLWIAAPVFADSATFGQKILPLNCVFEQVNDGTGTIIYLTPAACGQVITPPPSGNPGEVTIAGDNSQQFNTNREVFLVPTSSQGSGNFTNAGTQLPWQPIATLGSQNQKGVDDAAVPATPKLSTVAVAGAIAGIALIIVLVVFIF